MWMYHHVCLPYLRIGYPAIQGRRKRERGGSYRDEGPGWLAGWLLDEICKISTGAIALPASHTSHTNASRTTPYEKKKKKKKKKEQ